jgi:4-alpha-glucanotransferase
VDDAIRELAREAGIASDWIDAADQPQRVSISSLRSILAALGYPCASRNDIAESRARLRALSKDTRTFFTATAGDPIELTLGRDRTVLPAIDEPGYHHRRVGDRDITLAVAPPRCVTLGDIAPDGKLYGLAVQLYSLRRTGDGFGDTAALRDLVASAAREGAEAIALSPTHSLFAADPAHYGPYSPSSRLFLNPLYADPAAVFGAERVASLHDRAQIAQGALIDWPRAASAKYALLRRLFEDFAATDLTRKTALAADFEDFVRVDGDRLHEHALFEALHQHWFGAAEPKWRWSDWPAGWRAPDASAVREFANREAHAIRFHMFAQWLAAHSFAGVQRAAREGGMRIGLISDLAVGMNPGGSHAWSRQQDLLPDLTIGAPPDLFNPRGQDWGLTGFSPQALIASGFEPFIATLRAALRHAGGVRIDHVMGLTRLWLVPHGASPADGAYLSYPLDDMLRLIALESHRHRAIVIGEDLGTVQPEFRAGLARAGIAGMDVLWFQRDGNAFLPPDEWRRDAVAMTTTHDLPTVAGWWTGADIATRDAIGLADEKTETAQRAQNRASLWSAFQDAGVAISEPPADPAPVVDAAIAFTAKSPAALALIPLEDVLGVTEQPNLPGTIDEHPNWRRRLATPASELLAAPDARRRLRTLRERT